MSSLLPGFTFSQGADASFFKTGGTMSQDAPSYLPRRADEELYKTLIAGEYGYVLTSRQMGKSSLMVRTAARLRDAGVSVVMLDLTAFGHNLTPEQWYDGMRDALGDQLLLEDAVDDCWSARASASPLQRWVGVLKEVALPRSPGGLVVFIDEIDYTRSLPFSADEMFAAIRECYNRRTVEEPMRRLSFCLLGVATPSDLIRDTRTTPFNIGRRIELTDFTATEAAPLARGLGANQARARMLLRRVLYWTAGHPYLTQRLCLAIAEDPAIQDEADVDKLSGDLFLSNQARNSDSNLIFARDLLLRGDVDRVALLDLYAQILRGKRVPYEETSPLAGALRLSGITQTVDATMRTRNRIYRSVFNRRWIEQNLPDFERQRQRAAYRRGLLRAGGLAAFVVAALLLLAGYALHEEHVARAAAADSLRASDDSLRARDDSLRAREEARTQARAAQEAQVIAQRSAAKRALEEALQFRSAGDADKALLVLIPALAVYPSPDVDQQHLIRQAIACASSGISRLRAVLPHPARVTATDVSPTNGMIVTGADDGVIRFWDPETCKQTRTGDDLGEPVTKVGFSADGKHLLAVAQSGGNRGAVYIWGAGKDTGRQFARHFDAKVVSAEYCSAIESVVVGLTDGNVFVQKLTDDLSLPARIHHPGPLNAMAVKGDGAVIATCGSDGTIGLWETDTGRDLGKDLGNGSDLLRERVVTEEPFSLAFSPDGGFLAIGGAFYGQFLHFNPNPHWHRQLVEHASWVWAMRYGAGDVLMTASRDTTVRAWDTRGIMAPGLPRLLQAGAPLRHQTFVHSLAIAPGGEQVVTACEDKAARVWQRSTPASLFADGDPQVHCLAVSGDGRLVVSGNGEGDAGKLCFWNAATGEPIGAPRPCPTEVLGVAFSCDSRSALAACGKHVYLWETAPGMRPSPSRTINVGDVARAAAFSHDGRTLAVAYLGNANDINAEAGVRFWDPATGDRKTGELTYPKRIHSLCFSDNDRFLVGASENQNACVWDMATLEKLKELPHGNAVYAASFNPNGSMLFTLDWDGTGQFWDSHTWKPVGPVFHHPDRDVVTAGGFSPDGRMIATGGYTSTVRLWDAAFGSPLATFSHTPPVTCFSFTPDGKRLLTGCANGNIYAWPLPAPPVESAERLSLAAQVATNMELDAYGAVRVLNTDQWIERRDRLERLGGHPADFIPSLRPAPALGRGVTNTTATEPGGRAKTTSSPAKSLSTPTAR